MAKEKKGGLALNRPHGSWRAAWREIGGKKSYYRSRWEANYARYLEWLKGRGEIKDWEHEPKTFWFEKIKRGSRSYLPDFRVDLVGGEEEYHEVKGWMDKRSKTKLRRMKKYHPEVVMVLIDAPRYRAIASKMRYIIAGWEWE